MKFVTSADRPDTNVVRLDVAMRNSLLFQIVDDGEEVVTESLEQIDVEAAFLSKPVAERVGAGPLHEDAGPTAELESLAILDDVLVMELLENDDYRIRQVAAWWFARRPAQMRQVAEMATASTVSHGAIELNLKDSYGQFNVLHMNQDGVIR